MIIKVYGWYLNPEYIEIIEWDVKERHSIIRMTSRQGYVVKDTPENVVLEIHRETEGYIENPQLKKDREVIEKEKAKKEELHNLVKEILNLPMEEVMDKIYDVDYSSWNELSTKSINVLKSFKDMETLLHCTHNDLRKIPGVGRKTMNEILGYLRVIGVSLRRE